jgi:GWxTD domain-containing protein
MRLLSNILALTILLLALGSCTKQVNTNTNYAHLYNGKNTTIKPDYVIYHKSKDQTELHFRINSNDVLYARKDKSQPYVAKIQLHYELFGPESKKLILDSASVSIEDETAKKSSKYLTGKIDVKVPFGKEYILKVTAIDRNRNNSNDQTLVLSKTAVTDPQFFLVKNSETGNLLYNNYISKVQLVDITSEENKGKSVFVNKYFREFPIAAPPFSNINPQPFDYKPEEIIKYEIDDAGKFSTVFLDSGFVHIQMDTTKKQGLTFFGFRDNFPLVKNVFGMVDPLRFISSNTEFEKLTTAENTKQRVDEFWLSKCGTEDRAREIIKKYYNRVQDANEVFTSYIEGWKTDRGMVSLIFGSPKTVRKARDEEVWYYGEENNALALQFTFIQVDNPFTDNDYKLLRSPSYKSNWYRAVDAWRSGRVYWAQ